METELQQLQNNYNQLLAQKQDIEQQAAASRNNQADVVAPLGASAAAGAVNVIGLPEANDIVPAVPEVVAEHGLPPVNKDIPNLEPAPIV